MLFGRKVNLDEVSIAAPCPVDWEQMEGDSQIRFCSMCELNVYNISEMTRREAESFLQDQSGQLCLRLYRRQDGTLITKDCPVGRRMIDGAKRRVRAIAAAFVAMLNAPAVFGQQQNLKGADGTVKVDGSRDASTLFQVEPTVIGGRHYTTGRDERHKKVSPTLPPGVPIPDSDYAPPSQKATQQFDHTEVKSNADTSALDAFRAAQGYEVKEPDKALASYENAIAAFRNSKVNYDRTFADVVARKYANLLRKQNNSQKAAIIEKEFCDRK